MPTTYQQKTKSYKQGGYTMNQEKEWKELRCKLPKRCFEQKELSGMGWEKYIMDLMGREAPSMEFAEAKLKEAQELMRRAKSHREKHKKLNNDWAVFNEEASEENYTTHTTHSEESLRQ